MLCNIYIIPTQAFWLHHLNICHFLMKNIVFAKCWVCNIAYIANEPSPCQYTVPVYRVMVMYVRDVELLPWRPKCLLVFVFPFQLSPRQPGEGISSLNCDLNTWLLVQAQCSLTMTTWQYTVCISYCIAYTQAHQLSWSPSIVNL
jgi:hypothetical protein